MDHSTAFFLILCPPNHIHLTLTSKFSSLYFRSRIFFPSFCIVVVVVGVAIRLIFLFRCIVCSYPFRFVFGVDFILFFLFSFFFFSSLSPFLDSSFSGHGKCRFGQALPLYRQFTANFRCCCLLSYVNGFYPYGNDLK